MSPPRLAKIEKAVYRKDADYAVWDSRGLTIRRGHSARSTKLPEIALTPKLSSTEEILKTRELIADGDRSKGASGLSGSRRVGDAVYFLARWDDKSGQPWLEALVKVDMSGHGLHPELVGRFEGLSLARDLVDDEIFVAEGSLAVVTRKGDGTWGVASFDPTNASFKFKKVGKGLVSSWRLIPKGVLAEENTEFHSRTLSRVDLVTGDRRVLGEFEGDVQVLSREAPIIVSFATPRARLLRNLETGSELRLPQGARVRPSKAGVLVWLKDNPEHAVLYEPVRWQRLAALQTEAN